MKVRKKVFYTFPERFGAVASLVTAQVPTSAALDPGVLGSASSGGGGGVVFGCCGVAGSSGGS